MALEILIILLIWGPEGDHLGGEIIATGTVEEIKQNKNSKIGEYL